MAVTKSPRLGLDRWSAGTDLHPNRAEWDAQQALLDDKTAIDIEVATYADRKPAVRGTYMWVVDEQRLYRATATGWMTTAKIGGGGRGAPITVGPASAAVEGTSAYAARADHTHSLPLVTASVDGAMAKSDKVKLDSATSSASGSTLVERTPAGDANFGTVLLSNTPSSPTHATRKDYVDSQTEARLPFALYAGTGSIDSILDPGLYYQTSGTPINIGNGYPINGSAGALLVTSFGPLTGSYRIQEWTQWSGTFSNQRRWIRSTNSGASGWTAWRELAGTETATASADGLMSKADKAKLDGADASAVPSTLVTRDSSGKSAFDAVGVNRQPSATSDLTRKDYVDSTATSAASAAVNAIPNATSTTDGHMSKADKALLDGAVSTDTASRLIVRDSAGRARVKNPLNAQDISTKAYTDSTASSAASSAVNAIPNATSSRDGLMPKADKAKLDGATYNDTGGSLAQRDASGNTRFGQVRLTGSAPAGNDYATRKDYVDGLFGESLSFKGWIGDGTDLNTVTQPGVYYQKTNPTNPAALNYPIGLSNHQGTLIVTNYYGTASTPIQTFIASQGSSSAGLYEAPRIASRSSWNSGANWGGWGIVPGVETARTSKDGLMSKDDKKTLMERTYYATPESLVKRGSTGGVEFDFASVNEPRANSHATPKSYVDNAIASAVPDTGWRDIASLAKNLDSGASLKIRRRHDEVTIVFEGRIAWPDTRKANGTSESIPIVESYTNLPGFNASGPGNYQKILLSVEPALYISLSSSWNRIAFSIFSAPGERLPTGTTYTEFKFTRLTKDAWPTSLPGTATTL